MIVIDAALFRSISFSICAFFFLLTAIFLLFYKMKKNVERRKMYIYMIFFTFTVIILEIFSSFTIMNKDSIPLLNETLCRLYLFFVFLWPVIFMIYMFSYKKEYINKKFIVFGILVIILSMLACLFIPFEYSTANIYTIKGPIIVIMNIYCLLISIFEVALLLLKKVVIRNLSAVPLFMGTGLYFCIVLYQIISGNYFNIIAFMYTLIIIDLFYSSESQDYQLLEEFSDSKAQSEILNQNKDKFLSSMSKEIRTPMSNIIGLSDLILMNDSATVGSIQNDGKKIHEESINLLSIINNILDLARFEANKEELKEENYNFDELILDYNEYIVNKYHITPLYKFSENLPNDLYGDRAKIRKILELSIDNVLKKNNIDNINIEYGYSNLTAEKIDFDITLSFIYKSSSSYSQKDDLDLEDSIIGFCSKLINATVVKNILSDFKIEYKISFSQGIVGTKKLENIIERIAASLKNEDVEIKDYSNKRILVVDDSQININIVKRLFAKYNFTLDEALNGETCIDLVSKNQYDIIFLDDMMPGLSGTETLKEMKTRYSSIPPVIALTANSYDGLKEKYMEDGFSDYLSKPIEASKMNKILSNFLDNGGGNNAL